MDKTLNAIIEDVIVDTHGESSTAARVMNEPVRVEIGVTAAFADSKRGQPEIENCNNQKTTIAPSAAAKIIEFDRAVADVKINKDEEKSEVSILSTKTTIPSNSSSFSKKGKWFSSKSKTKTYACTPVTKEGTNLHASKQYEESLLILSLPIDSLHTIASYLTPVEWTNFGLGNKGANKICREICRRVRMHGFRCATEIITAWKLGQHADSKELCALYVSNGVPIYPHSLGHSYHTLIWRLAVEAKHFQGQQTNEEPSADTSEFQTPTPTGSIDTTSRQSLTHSATEDFVNYAQSGVSHLDPFYNERDDTRIREEMNPGSSSNILTYLEEKALYNINKKDNKSEGLQQYPLTPVHMSQPDRKYRFRRNSLIGFRRDTVTIPRQLTRSNSFSGNRFRSNHIHLKVHRHLLDQHLLGRPGVNDGEGLMITPSINFSADFFHPFFKFHPSTNTEIMDLSSSMTPSPIDNTGNTFNHLIPAYNQVLPTVETAPIINYHHTSGAVATTNLDNNNYNIEELSVARRGESAGSTVTNDSDSDVEGGAVYPRPNLFEPTHNITAAEAAVRPSNITPTVPWITTSNHSVSPTRMHSGVQDARIHNDILSNIDLEVYGASSRGFKSNDDENLVDKEMKNYLKARFAFYHRRLEKHVLNHDSYGFEESIMDLWDEFFPHTKDIQYYDNNTAVPRISRLHKFLTKPCPKAIGIVQCEIERVKLGSKKKGVNMKGRLFPTYEYRLFIRHPSANKVIDTDEIDANVEKKVRHDTVLMMAKNRGRKHTENKVQSSSLTSTKKGSNNYYLYLPSQDDLDFHYKDVNKWDDIARFPHGAGSRIGESEFSGLLGRLQSNFVGTEFQIFTYEKTNSTKTKSFACRQSLNTGGCSDEEIAYNSVPFFDLGSPSASRRRRFKPLSMRGRSVSAAETFDSQHNRVQTHSTFFEEEEDGAITYTANLLGSRPRIMDVCIPKVNSDGPRMEWNRYLENCKDHDADPLLNHLKRMSQNGEIDEHGRLINPADNSAEVLGTNDKNYSPPGDVGLLSLQNRPPWWNVELGSFVLNFGGRVSVASVKNFQLCDRNDQDHIMLQFGRIEGRHSFTMDFQYPLTGVQAFAIAISSLQSKISFG